MMATITPHMQPMIAVRKNRRVRRKMANTRVTIAVIVRAIKVTSKTVMMNTKTMTASMRAMIMPHMRTKLVNTMVMIVANMARKA